MEEELDDVKEGAKLKEKVTHVVMDRPMPVGGIEKGKEYVQPQYIVDSINNLFLLPTKPYLPGIVSFCCFFAESLLTPFQI